MDGEFPFSEKAKKTIYEFTIFAHRFIGIVSEKCPMATTGKKQWGKS
jgi:hypothetical protein